jgi:signal transduction histidine kinase
VRSSVPEQAPVEIGRIGRAFNQMAETFDEQRRVQLEFLAGVAHDLRDPLSTIKLGIDRIITLKAAPEEIHARLPLFQRQVERMNQMISDLAEITMAEYGLVKLNLVEMDLTEAARSAVERHRTASPGHEIVLRPASQPQPFCGDPERIDRILDNLLSNAIKYSPAGGTIEVATERAANEAVVSVKDPGVGIAPENHELIFLPFRRVASTGDPPGLGVGLAVARRIVQAHGGHIELESALAQGATFRLYFPMAARLA